MERKFCYKNTILLPTKLVIFLLLVAASGCTEREDTSQAGSADKLAANTQSDYQVVAEPGTASDISASNTSCVADPAWVTDPYNPPTEMPDQGSDFCDFYQFAWQWFIHVMAPSPADSSIRVFQDSANYPYWQASGVDSCSSVVSDKKGKPQFFVRLVKDSDNSTAPLLPERIGQAGGGDTIYDQNGNVVFYSVQFNRSLCDAAASGNLPAGTTELKLAWRVISESEKADYVWMEADVITDTSAQTAIPELLGLVGFHLVNSTPGHPEFVWASYQHKNNAPDCVGADSKTGWSFTSDACVACLQAPDEACLTSCKFNEAQPAMALKTTTPSEICRVYRDGSAADDNKVAENLPVVDHLNTQLVGSNGIITQLPPTNMLAVLQNYLNIGALWESDSTLASTDLMNLRGSLQLANPVMETTFQGTISIVNGEIANSPKGDAVNCFACHAYMPNKTAEPKSISHIFGSIHGQ